MWLNYSKEHAVLEGTTMKTGYHSQITTKSGYAFSYKCSNILKMFLTIIIGWSTMKYDLIIL